MPSNLAALVAAAVLTQAGAVPAPNGALLSAAAVLPSAAVNIHQVGLRVAVFSVPYAALKLTVFPINRHALLKSAASPSFRSTSQLATASAIGSTLPTR